MDCPVQTRHRLFQAIVAVEALVQAMGIPRSTRSNVGPLGDTI
jgi:hypothetical protein